jgi:SAM-dependent methyltransferase
VRTEARAGERAELPSSSVYDREYFLSSACEGLRDYLAGGLASLKSRELDYLDVTAGMLVLDLGCGRGESSGEIRRRQATPVAMDYSEDAVVLTAELLAPDALVIRADAAHLPFRSAAFDAVLMGDVVEHLPWPLAVQMLQEVDRVLDLDGKALVHTSPNTWFIAVVKRPLQLLMRALHRTEVVARFAEYDRLRAVMHPNELNPYRISKLMRRAGVRARTWVDRDVIRSGASEWTENLSSSRWMRLVAVVAGLWPMRLVLGNDMYALITKTKSDV